MSFLLGRPGTDGTAAPSGVVDVDVQPRVPDAHGELDAGVVARVLEGVGESFLHYAVHRQLDTAVQGVQFAARAVGDLGTGGADPGAQGVDVGHARLGAELGRGGGLGLLTQHAEHTAQFAQRLAPGVTDEQQGLLATFRGEVGRVRASVGESDDDGEVVTDDVVHLAGHTGAFGGGGQLAALVAFDLQAGRAVAQDGELGASDPYRQTERDCRRDGAEQEEQRVQDGHRGRQPQGYQPQGGRGDGAGHGQPPELSVQHQAVEGDQQGDIGAQPDSQSHLDEEHRGDHGEGE